jgi:hypothetical protein
METQPQYPKIELHYMLHSHEKQAANTFLEVGKEYGAQYPAEELDFAEGKHMDTNPFITFGRSVIHARYIPEDPRTYADLGAEADYMKEHLEMLLGQRSLFAVARKRFAGQLITGKPLDRE